MDRGAGEEVNRKTHIIVHHSATKDGSLLDLSAIRRFHLSRGWRDVGYHLLIEQVAGRYEAIIGRPWLETGAHAPGYNKKGIGVCFVGNWQNNAPPPELIGFGARHLAAICLMLGIAPENILPHRDVRETKCPGDLFPFDELKRLVIERVHREQEDD